MHVKESGYVDVDVKINKDKRTIGEEINEGFVKRIDDLIMQHEIQQVRVIKIVIAKDVNIKLVFIEVNENYFTEDYVSICEEKEVNIVVATVNEDEVRPDHFKD